MASLPAQGDRSHYDLPSAQTLKEAGELPILDEYGASHPFSSLYTNKPAGSKSLTIFIRHFFCGNCEDYVRELNLKLPPKLLATANTTLTIVGHGSSSNIAGYRTRTACPFEIFCDPTRALHLKLGMTSKLELGDTRPDYIKGNLVMQAVNSIVNGLSAGTDGFKGGDFRQNGGEWLFEDGHLRWGRRMRNTRDHARVGELRDVVGLGQ